MLEPVVLPVGLPLPPEVVGLDEAVELGTPAPEAETLQSFHGPI